MRRQLRVALIVFLIIIVFLIFISKYLNHASGQDIHKPTKILVMYGNSLNTLVHVDDKENNYFFDVGSNIANKLQDSFSEINSEVIFFTSLNKDTQHKEKYESLMKLHRPDGVVQVIINQKYDIEEKSFFVTINYLGIKYNNETSDVFYNTSYHKRYSMFGSEREKLNKAIISKIAKDFIRELRKSTF